MVGERGVLRRWRREKKKRARGGSRNLRRDLFFPFFFPISFLLFFSSVPRCKTTKTGVFHIFLSYK